MKYFQNDKDEVFGYDENDPNQEQLIFDAIGKGLKDVTSSFASAPSPVKILSDAKADAAYRINSFAKEKRALIAGTNDDAEIAGWGNKFRIANDIISGKASNDDKAVFQAEITARDIAGETLEIFAQNVIDNAAFFANANGVVDGLKRKAHDLISSAQTTEEIAAALMSMKKKAEDALAAIIWS